MEECDREKQLNSGQPGSKGEAGRCQRQSVLQNYAPGDLLPLTRPYFAKVSSAMNLSVDWFTHEVV